MTMTLVTLGADRMHEAAMVRRTALWQRLPGLRDVHTPAEDAAYWREQLLPRCTILGRLEADRLVAVIAYAAGWIEQLYILPVAQGRGIGTCLVNQAKADMAEIALWTFQRNTGARAFYERQGFSAVEQTDGAGNEAQEPDILYRWRRFSG
ncbi:MAG TPA: GNAT family N-acetyltransferase [Devosiaceae bacterium]|jgi:GNAT superfamily N-acetyltransferase